ncbi:MAG: mycofactocin precursor [Solirubrobacterales bacterium]|nr:mycofactocin precursor [Solirubrobacterales bacterium]MBV9714665.1 mycofactocin precursor [Solirubrobacterales bacterium]
MPDDHPQSAGAASAEPEPALEPIDRPVEDLVEEDLLVEDVSIDGMCGVY